jgi:translation initiation factor 1A
LFKDDDGQQYAVVTAMLGNGRLTAKCEDAIERMGKIRGSMRRSDWISVGDVVLISLRAFQDEKCDVLHRYIHDDVRRLRHLGELGSLRLGDDRASEDAAAEDDIVFEDDENDMSFVDDV